MTDAVFLTDGELAKRLNFKPDEFAGTLIVLERSGFPPKDPQFGNRRYWPAVKAWLDRRYKLAPSLDPGNSARQGARQW